MLLPAVLDVIGCKEVIVPPHPGLFSALGLLSTDQVFTANRSAYTILSGEVAAQVDKLFSEMEIQLSERLPAGTEVSFLRSFDARLVGQSWETPFVAVPEGTIDEDAITTMIGTFHDTYESRSGNRFEAFPVEGVTFRVRAVVETGKVDYPVLPERGNNEVLSPIRTVTLRYLGDLEVADGAQEASVYEREDLRAGDVIAGPAVVNESLCTTHIGVTQQASVGRYGELIITKK